ncbi:MAG: sarcosine oxidase subunit alpha, partial [Candidatus Promineifilaceae bacterium]
MAATPTRTTMTGNRIAPQPNEVIDRSKTISFKFNGKSYSAHPGDTIASALTAAGVKMISRSFKYHRPRGLSGYGHDISSMMQIGDEVSVSAWLRKVENGMVVNSINAWPSIDNDMMSVTQLADRFLPVGFYYKTFIRPTFMWPHYETFLRNAAGLGKLNTAAGLPGGYHKQYLHGDVVVVGGGPAGMSAALSAASGGARVLLIDEADELGGHLRYSGQNGDKLAELSQAVHDHSGITVYSNTQVVGRYDHNWLSAVSGRCLYKIRAKSLILATGARDQPLVFPNNDRPGVFLGSALARLLHQYGTVPGKNVLIVTANDDGWQLAADLQAAGVTIAAVADHRPESAGGAVAQAVIASGVKAAWEYTIANVEGRKAVTGADIAPIKADGSVDTKAIRSFHCDTVALAIAWAPENALLYQAGCTIAYDHGRNEFISQEFPDGIFAAGRVMGTHNLDTQIAEGDAIGKSAAASVGMGDAPAQDVFDRIASSKKAEPVRTSTLVMVDSKGKKFV